MIVVADTSGLLDLCRIGEEDRLARLVREVVIPEEVAVEFDRLAALTPRLQGLTLPVWIRRRRPSTVSAGVRGADLDPGEPAARGFRNDRNRNQFACGKLVRCGLRSVQRHFFLGDRRRSTGRVIATPDADGRDAVLVLASFALCASCRSNATPHHGDQPCSRQRAHALTIVSAGTPCVFFRISLIESSRYRMCSGLFNIRPFTLRMKPSIFGSPL